MTPSHFSAKNPFLQLAWDATSLSTFMECPRKYYYWMIRAIRGGGKVDLEFGGFFASACETFWKAVLAGKTHEQATLDATEYALKATWAKTADRPWGGDYVTGWRCSGEEPYKNDAGNRAVCPDAKAGVFHPATVSPGMCGHCGSKITTERRYVPNNQKKNRISLIRAVVWYCLDQPEKGGFQPVKFDDGTPAVELPFRVPLPLELSTGERPILCGYFDRLARLGSDEVYVVDNKTTASGSFGDLYFDKFSPHVQFDTYDLVASMIFPELNVRGVINDACQVLVGGVKFAKRQYTKTDGLRQEHLNLIESTIHEADSCASTARVYGTNGPVGKSPIDAYPMRKSSCPMCPFKGICNKDPAMRERYLKADFAVGERWNPLEER